LDVAKTAVESGAGVAVLYSSTASWGRWLQIPATPTDELSGGTYQRFEFEISEYVPTEGMSGTSLTGARIELIPFLSVNGARVFDHNRVADPFTNYLLTVNNSWSLGDDAGVCLDNNDRHTTVVSVDGNGLAQDGPLVAGGTLEVHYDISLMTNCLATHNGYPFWDTRAFVQFLPGGEVLDETVRVFGNEMGHPTNEVSEIGAMFTIPGGSDRAEIWFRHFSNASGGVCEQWDSNNSNNYVLDVVEPPQWIGNLALKISRGSSHPCSDAAPLDVESEFVFDSWARQRAEATHVCFEVWQPGVTDWENPDLWRELDVEVHARYGSEGSMSVSGVERVDSVGNNARYGWNLRNLDPFRYDNSSCDIIREFGVEDAGSTNVPVEYFFTANGVALRGSGGAPLRGIFQGSATSLCP
jgi:hypothetical protein